MSKQTVLNLCKSAAVILPIAAWMSAPGLAAAQAAENQQSQMPPNQAQANQQAQEAQLAVPFGVINGQLVISGQNLLFIDQQQPSNSFVIPRAAIKRVEPQGGDLVLNLTQPIQDPAGSQSRVVLRLANPAGAQNVAGWFNSTQTGGSANREATAGTNANAPGTMSFDVKHDHFRGSDRGRLMITPTGVDYESVTDVNSSRRWNMSDIKQVKQAGPYKLTIEPFTGDTYNFQVLGKGIDPDQFHALENDVVAARSQQQPQQH